MKKHIILLTFAVIISILTSQTIPGLDFTSLITQSALTSDGEVLLRMPYTQQMGEMGIEIEAITLTNLVVNTGIFASVNDYEQKTIIKAPLPGIGATSIGFRLISDAYGMVVPWNITHPNQRQNYLLTAENLVQPGDPVTDPALRINSHGFALTNTAIWSLIESVSEEYPTTNITVHQEIFGIPTVISVEAYAYGVLLINLDNLLSLSIEDLLNIDFSNFAELAELLEDVVAYTVLRIDLTAPSVPIIGDLLEQLNIRSGVYKIPLSALANPEEFAANIFDYLVSIGDININLNAGALMLGVNYSTLANDPDFGIWPSETKTLLAMPISIKISFPQIVLLDLIGGGFPIADIFYSYGVPSIVYCEPYMMDNSTPSLPYIEKGSNIGDIFQIFYSQDNGFYPIVAEFRLEDEVIQGFSQSLLFQNNSIFYFQRDDLFDDGGVFVFSVDGENFVEIELEPVGSENENVELINLTRLIGNYPNPFNPVTQISFNLKNSGKVLLEIFNIKGQKVDLLIDDFLESGVHTITWEANNMSSGVYFYRLKTDDLNEVKKMVLQK